MAVIIEDIYRLDLEVNGGDNINRILNDVEKLMKEIEGLRKVKKKNANQSADLAKKEERLDAIMKQEVKTVDGLTRKEKLLVAIVGKGKKLTDLYTRAVGRLKGVQEQRRRSTEKVEKSESKLQKSLANGLKGLQAYFAIGIIKDWGQQFFDTAKGIESTLGKSEKVFGQYSSKVRQFARENANEYGLTALEFERLAASTQDLLVPIGFDRGQATDITLQLQGLSGALSEWSDGKYDAAQTSEILTKSLLGEREQLKGLGIDIKEADVKQRLLAKGQDKLTGNAKKQATALATLELVMEKSTDAQEAFANGGDSLQRQSARNTAKLKEVAEGISEFLIPAFAGLLDIGASVLSFFDDYSTRLSKTVKAQESQAKALGKQKKAYLQNKNELQALISELNGLSLVEGARRDEILKRIGEITNTSFSLESDGIEKANANAQKYLETKEKLFNEKFNKEIGENSREIEKQRKEIEAYQKILEDGFETETSIKTGATISTTDVDFDRQNELETDIAKRRSEIERLQKLNEDLRIEKEKNNIPLLESAIVNPTDDDGSTDPPPKVIPDIDKSTKSYIKNSLAYRKAKLSEAEAAVKNALALEAENTDQAKAAKLLKDVTEARKNLTKAEKEYNEIQLKRFVSGSASALAQQIKIAESAIEELEKSLLETGNIDSPEGQQKLAELENLRSQIRTYKEELENIQSKIGTGEIQTLDTKIQKLEEERKKITELIGTSEGLKEIARKYNVDIDVANEFALQRITQVDAELNDLDGKRTKTYLDIIVRREYTDKGEEDPRDQPPEPLDVRQPQSLESRNIINRRIGFLEDQRNELDSSDPDFYLNQSNLDREIEKLKSRLDDLELTIDVTLKPEATAADFAKLNEDVQRKTKPLKTIFEDLANSDFIPVVQQIGQLSQSVNQVFAQLSQAQTQRVEDQQRAVDKVTKIADEGNAELLEAEEDRLRKAEQKRRSFVNAQKALNAVAAASNAIVAITQAAAQSGVGAIVTVPAVIGAIVAGIASVLSAVKGAKTGEEYIDGPGTTTSDSILRRVSKGERVVKAQDNKDYYDTLHAIHTGAVPADALNNYVLGYLNDPAPGQASNSTEKSEKTILRSVMEKVLDKQTIQAPVVQNLIDSPAINRLMQSYYYEHDNAVTYGNRYRDTASLRESVSNYMSAITQITQNGSNTQNAAYYDGFVSTAKNNEQQINQEQLSGGQIIERMLEKYRVPVAQVQEQREIERFYNEVAPSLDFNFNIDGIVRELREMKQEQRSQSERLNFLFEKLPERMPQSKAEFKVDQKGLALKMEQTLKEKRDWERRAK